MSSAKITSIIDLIRLKVLDKLKNKKDINRYQSSNSFILSLYFHFGTSLFFFISCCIFYNVFMTDIILCSDGFDKGAASDKKIPFVYVNYCLSYPKLNDGSFALFYKWVPWIISMCCFILYTPKILINKFSCNFIACHLMKINNIENEYYFYDRDLYKNKGNNNNNNNNNNNRDNSDNKNKKITNLLDELITLRWNKCKVLYYQCLFIHIYSLMLNIFLIFLLDFLLQGRFSFYAFNAFPFQRDAEYFSDKMSQTFYPFSDCIIPTKRIMFGREERLKCHLTLMEYYEKVFFIIWLYLFILPIVTFIYILYLFSLFKNNYNSFLKHLLKIHLNYNLVLMSKNIIQKKIKHAKIV